MLPGLYSAVHPQYPRGGVALERHSFFDRNREPDRGRIGDLSRSVVDPRLGEPDGIARIAPGDSPAATRIVTDSLCCLNLPASLPDAVVLVCGPFQRSFTANFFSRRSHCILAHEFSTSLESC